MVRILPAIVLALALGAPAEAAEVWESDWRAVRFDDSYDVFEGIAFDTGLVPQGSPIGVRLYVSSDGGYEARIDTESEVWWPDPDTLSHGFVGLTEGGFVELITDIEIKVQLALDLSLPDGWDFGAIYYDIWSDGLYREDRRVFDGLLLADSLPDHLSILNQGETIGPYDTGFTVFSVVQVVFAVEAYPQIHLDLSGSRIETNDGWGTQLTVLESDAGVFDVPSHDPTHLELLSSYFANLSAGLDLVVVPSVSVCAPALGCLTPFQMSFPFPLASTNQERRFSPVSYDHPLPVLGLPLPDHDFGELEVGALSNLALSVDNLGRLDLEGTVSVEGSPAFTVFPDNLYAQPDAHDGVVVTFAPEEEGIHGAVLTLVTNDPGNPTIEVALAGEGVPRPEPPPPPEAEHNTLAVDQCTCAAGAGSAGWAALLPLLVVGLRRRRPSPLGH